MEKQETNVEKLWRALDSVHTIKGYPSSLWVLKAHLTGGRQAAFYDINDAQRVITVDWRTTNVSHPLKQYKVFTDYPVNQEAIDKATDAGETSPPPVKEHNVPQRLYIYLQRKDLVLQWVAPEVVAGEKEIHTMELTNLMKEIFPDADLEQFKGHHMIKVWKWYLTMKKWYEALPAEVETPAIVTNEKDITSSEKVEFKE